MKIININLGSKNYDVMIQKGIVKDSASIINNLYDYKKIAIITDENVYELHGDSLNKSFGFYGYDIKFIVIKPGEKSKSLDVLSYIYGKLADYNIKRDDLIVAFGGGVVGDLSGFAACTYLRGIDYIQIPTTLLAQIDSSIGGKAAVNLENGKNLVGAFYQPKLVLIDYEVLDTLPEKYIKDGLGEVIKYACIKDSEFFKTLSNMKISQFKDNMEYIIYNCCNIKRKIVEGDEFDVGDRMLLNFGHTLGHAIEKLYNYSYTHGEAISLGMYYITKLSEKMGFTEAGTSESIKNILTNYDIKYELSDLNLESLSDLVLLDKKNKSEYITFVFLKKIGDGFLEKFPSDNINNFLRSYCG